MYTVGRFICTRAYMPHRKEARILCCMSALSTRSVSTSSDDDDGDGDEVSKVDKVVSAPQDGT